MKLYYYLFYKLYNFWEFISIPKFWSNGKAGISIMAIEMWFLLAIINYYTIFIDQSFRVNNIIVYIILGVIIVFNTVIFVFYNQWEKYFEEFDQMSKKKNILYGIITWIVIISIILNIVYSFILVNQLKLFNQ